MDEQEDSKTRTHSVKGREFIIKCSDPYGFWSIKPNKGQVPKELSGSYTMLEYATQAINLYVGKNDNPS